MLTLFVIEEHLDDNNIPQGMRCIAKIKSFQKQGPKDMIIDTTLREGEQTPGVLFSLSEKKLILDGLVRIGVGEAELGISSTHYSCPGLLIEYCRNVHPGLNLSLWCRCKQEDIAHGISLRPDILSLSIPVSNIHLKERLSRDKEWALRAMTKGIEQAKNAGVAVSVGFEDATRCSQRRLQEFASVAEKHGAMRIRVADTVGISTPKQIADITQYLKAILTSCKLAVHTHNDFGMATANGLAALDAGASFVDAVVLGLGERTGCARLEEVVGYLSLIKNSNSLHPEFLKPLAHYVAQITKSQIPGNQPLIGNNIFTCETGLHVQGLQNNPHTYEPYAPRRVQAERKILFGSKSGRRAVVQQLSHMGIELAHELPDSAVATLRETATKLKRPLNGVELLQILPPKSYCPTQQNN